MGFPVPSLCTTKVWKNRHPGEYLVMGSQVWQNGMVFFWVWFSGPNVTSWPGKLGYLGEGLIWTFASQVLPSDPFEGFRWPFQGLSDLQLGDQKVTWKKLVNIFQTKVLIGMRNQPPPRMSAQPASCKVHIVRFQHENQTQRCANEEKSTNKPLLHGFGSKHHSEWEPQWIFMKVKFLRSFSSKRVIWLHWLHQGFVRPQMQDGQEPIAIDGVISYKFTINGRK